MRRRLALVALASILGVLAVAHLDRGGSVPASRPSTARRAHPRPPTDAWFAELVARQVPCDYSLAGVDCGFGWRGLAWHERPAVPMDPVTMAELSPCAGSRYQHTDGPYCGDQGLAFDPVAGENDYYISPFDILWGARLPGQCEPPRVETPSGTCVWASCRGDVTGDGRADTVMVIGPQHRGPHGMPRPTDMPRAILAVLPATPGACAALSGWIGYSRAMPEAGTDGCDRVGVWLVDMDRDGSREIVLAETRWGGNTTHSALIAYHWRADRVERLDEIGSIYWFMAEDYDGDGRVEIVAPGGKYAHGEAWQFRLGRFCPAPYPEAIAERRMVRLTSDRCLEGGTLDLAGTRPNDAQLRHLANQTGLEGLVLTEARVTDAGLVHLAKLTRLERLDLTGTRVTGPGLAHLAGMSRLGELQLRGAPVTDEGLASLPALPELTTLNLSSTSVTDAGLSHLLRFRGLSSLGLCGTRISDTGLRELRALDSLTRLSLSETRVTDEGILDLSYISGLRELRVYGTCVTPRGVERLKAVLPGCEVSL